MPRNAVIFHTCSLHVDVHQFSRYTQEQFLFSNIVAAFRGMHVSPAKHSYGWLPRKCDYWTDTQTDGQTDAGQKDPYVLLCFAGDTKSCDIPHLFFTSLQPLLLLSPFLFLCFFFGKLFFNFFLVLLIYNKRCQIENDKLSLRWHWWPNTLYQIKLFSSEFFCENISRNVLLLQFKEL